MKDQSKYPELEHLETAAGAVSKNMHNSKLVDIVHFLKSMPC